MTAATDAPVRPRPPRTAGAVRLTAARLLRLELRRNAMPWILPLIAALFWFDSYRPSTGMPPIWILRTFWNMGQGHTIIDFGPFVAGVAAWMGSPGGRRGTAAPVTPPPPPPWAVQLAPWAATLRWGGRARLGRRAAAALDRRGGHAGRGGGGRDRRRAGRHRAAGAARHGHSRAARRRQ